MSATRTARAGVPAFHATRRMRLTIGSPAHARATLLPPRPVPAFERRRSPVSRRRPHRARPRPCPRALAMRLEGCAWRGCGPPHRPSAGQPRTPPIRCRGRQTLPPVLHETPRPTPACARLGYRSSPWLGRQPRPALRPPARQNRATSTGPHADAESMSLVTTAVVGLEGSLGHIGVSRDRDLSARHERRLTAQRSISKCGSRGPCSVRGGCSPAFSRKCDKSLASTRGGENHGAIVRRASLGVGSSPRDVMPSPGSPQLWKGAVDS